MSTSTIWTFSSRSSIAVITPIWWSLFISWYLFSVFHIIIIAYYARYPDREVWQYGARGMVKYRPKIGLGRLLNGWFGGLV